MGEMIPIRLELKNFMSYSADVPALDFTGMHTLCLPGVTVLVDPKSAPFITGMTLDYSTANLLENGWKYINPNVQKSCGCGTSFTPK